MHKTIISVFILTALMFWHWTKPVQAGEVPPAMPLVIQNCELIPRIRIVERENGLPKVIDLELRCNTQGGGLFVVDPFFTCQWPMYSSVRFYGDNGEPLGYAEMPPLENWEGETQGRYLAAGQVCGRRFVLSFNGGSPAPPTNNGPRKRARIQLVLHDGIAIHRDKMPSIGRAFAKRPSEQVVARSELVELGEIPTGAHLYLKDPEGSEPSSSVKSGLQLRLDGPSKCNSDHATSYIDVILHNNSSVMSPLFDPGQAYYGTRHSPLEWEVISRPDGERIASSKDGIGPFGGNSYRPSGEIIVKLPPHTFYGRSQPWLDTRQPGRFRLNVEAHDWILCHQILGKYTIEDNHPNSTVLTSVSIDYTVE